MSTLEQYIEALHKFCCDLSVTVGAAVEGDDVDQVGMLLTTIRETIANLLLCELECERVLHHG